MEFVLSAFADEASAALDGQIAACRANGIRHIEMRGVDGRSVTALTAAEAKEIAAKLRAEGFALSAVGSPLGKINIADDFAPHLELFRHTAELANILGTPNIRMFSFYPPEGQRPEDVRGKVMERLAAFDKAAHEAGVVCCHENEKDIYGDLAPRCLDILQAFPRMAGIFDFANYVQCGQDTPAAWKLLKEHTMYFHIKDALKNGQVVPAGHGDGHIYEILKDAAPRPGRCFLTLEPHLTVFDGFAALEKDGVSMQGQSYAYASNREAFDAAAAAVRELLGRLGYAETQTPDGIAWVPAGR